jgi:hypothetical protein
VFFSGRAKMSRAAKKFSSARYYAILDVKSPAPASACFIKSTTRAAQTPAELSRATHLVFLLSLAIGSLATRRCAAVGRRGSAE